MRRELNGERPVLASAQGREETGLEHKNLFTIVLANESGLPESYIRQG